MELVVKFCIYFTRSGISFPGLYLVPISHSIKLLDCNLTFNGVGHWNFHVHLDKSKHVTATEEEKKWRGSYQSFNGQ
jgi:hypothetical protein